MMNGSIQSARVESQNSARLKNESISIVLPLYNEAAVLNRLYQAVRNALENEKGISSYEILFVNDGSTDKSFEVLEQIASDDCHVRVLHFSRNFGHQAAVQAGLKHATGDAIVLMDSDMQDNPASIPQFIAKWREGFDVVYAVRTDRKENIIKRAMFHSFYRVLNFVSRTPMPMDAGNFGLIDARVAQQIVSMGESDRYFPGLRQWVGFRQTGIEIERHARHDEKPRVSIFQLFQLAKTAIFSFSRVPLSMFYVIAMLSTLVCLGCICFTVYHKVFTQLAVPGWTSITIVASLFGALNSLGIGILGEYVVRIYDQVRDRPQFIVSRFTNFEAMESCELESKLLEEVRELKSEVSSGLVVNATTISLLTPTPSSLVE